MVDENLKSLFDDMALARLKKIQKIKEENGQIKSKLLVEIELVVKYLEELKHRQHIDREAVQKFPSLFELNNTLIFRCAEQAHVLKRIFESIDTENESLNYLVALDITLSNIPKNYNVDNYSLMPNDLATSQASLKAIESFIVNFKQDKDKYNTIITDEIKNILLHAEDEIKRFRRIRNIADNAKTEYIYDQAVKKFRKSEYIYRFLFLSMLFMLLVVSLVFWNSDYLNNIIDKPTYATSAIFWSVKITTLIVGITLMTYFLRQSSHYQRLADQNYQTQIELQAFPSFMESIPTDEAASVRKELALKYFGREIDGAAHKDMSNLISDQMKSTTEMVKAATDVLKVKG